MLVLLLTVMAIIITYIWFYQKNDTMLMKHWIELIILETLVLETSHLFKAIISKYVKDEQE